MLFKGIGDLIPLYALYAVLFADHGLSAGQISSLLAMWSATAFLLEVPSGAWADTVSRRGLLVMSGVLLTAGFTCWTVLPTYLGFAIGFVLWGTSGALVSGTFEALLYDELVARNEQRAYPRIIGYARAASEAAIVIAILGATPLYIWGGYPLLGWCSVAFAAVHTLVGLSLPSAPKAVSASAVEDLEDSSETSRAADGLTAVMRDPSASGFAGQLDGDIAERPHAAHSSETGRVAIDAAETGPFGTYLNMLRTGVGEAIRVRAVRNVVALGALLFGVTAFDEYFALLAQEVGVATAVVPVLVGITVVGSLVGSVSAGRTEGMSARAMAIAVGLGGVLFVGGAVVAGLAVRWPGAVYVLAGVGFTAIGASYGIVYNASVVAGARLQDAIEGPARATVTSVSGLAAEVVALAVFGFAAIATMWLSMSTTVALLGASLLAIALLIPFSLPSRIGAAAEYEAAVADE
ncbi:MFS transporter [Nocardia anaemiae]|uniref:MFS transporter n=1 Tax=Nocardia anaemiae TaxID=263910 RepID=UPI0007C7A710|nr:MFS transporter [Nocardia anaemiae]